jgi:SRSO17 transposase
LVYASERGDAFIDRELHMPRSWTDDPARCAAAGGSARRYRVRHQTGVAQQMIPAALDAGTPCWWVAGDEVYGNAPKLRAHLVERGIGYVLAVAKDHRITTGTGTHKAEQLAARLAKRSWRRLSAGPGAKGQRLYHWAWIETTDPAVAGEASAPGQHWLLVRRSIRTGELAFYRAYAPRRTRLAALVRVAGSRWTVEEAFQSGKELAALDEHQVRTWTS